MENEPLNWERTAVEKTRRAVLPDAMRKIAEFSVDVPGGVAASLGLLWSEDREHLEAIRARAHRLRAV